MPARFPEASVSVEAARQRRGVRAGERSTEIQWFIDEVSQKISLTMKQRVSLTTAFLKDKVIRNISRPVTKGKGPRGGNVVIDRSKPGEFPKAETTQLMKTVFSVVRESSLGVYDGFVGTSLDYGLILETKMNRSFLVRSLREESRNLKLILTGPIK